VRKGCNVLCGRLGSARAGLSSETGAVAIIVALFLVILLVMGAFVLDLSALYDHDRELQSAADAGALAGVQEIIFSKGNLASAADKAREYVSSNAAVTSVEEANLVPWDPIIDSRSITVELRENHIPFSLARVIGHTEGSVTARAKAELMYLTGLSGLFPVAIPYLQPHHFRITYGSGGSAVGYDLTNPDRGSDEDGGLFAGSRTGSVGLAPGLHSVTLEAQDEDDSNLCAPWTGVGSFFVPDGTVNLTTADRSRIRRVDVTRNITVPTGDPMAQLSESVTIRLRTSEVTEPSVQVEVTVSGKNSKTARVTLDSIGGGVYEGTTTIAPGSFDATYGEATVTITTYEKNKNSTYPAGVPVAFYKMFQRGSSVIYVDQGDDPWDNYSAPGSSESMTISAQVLIKVYRFGVSTVLKPSQQRLASFVGQDGWADMFTQANLEDEILLALGLIEPRAGWELNPDVSGPTANHNGTADIGEWVPFKPGLRVGQWKKSLLEAEGETVSIALVTPDPEAFKHDSMVIQSFGAFEITAIIFDGNDVDIIGRFVRWLDSGAWSPDKPTGIYVETAVLTE
jgi:hypothetical protein